MMYIKVDLIFLVCMSQSIPVCTYTCTYEHSHSSSC
jgi:hypothetical protein